MVYTNPCVNCGYWWQEEWEDHPSCHYDGPVNWAPCEADDPLDFVEEDEGLYDWEEEWSGD